MLASHDAAMRGNGAAGTVPTWDAFAAKAAIASGGGRMMAGKGKRFDPFKNFKFRVVFAAAAAGIAAFFAARKLTKRP